MTASAKAKLHLTKTLFCLLLVLALGIGGYRNMAGMRAGALKSYAPIEESLDKMLAKTQNLVRVIAPHLPEDDMDLNVLTVASEGLRESLKDPARARPQCATLLEAAESIALRLKQSEPFIADELERNMANRQIAEIKSLNEIIGHQTYNREAEKYNRYIEGFPRSGIARLCGIKPVPLY